MKRKVGIWVNQSKVGSQALGLKLIHWFLKRNWDVYTEWQDIINQKTEFTISLGGDGTLLETAREVAPYSIPVLGVNLGKLGFLCEIEKEEVFEALEKILSSKYTIEERLMLCGNFNIDENKETEVYALNDVVFTRDNLEGLVTLETRIAGEALASVPADGLIISTPTGSTAYSLSAGGPILAPNTNAILLTHLAAHSRSARPMVISDQELLEVKLIRGKECKVTFDGVNNYILPEGASIKIKKAPISALFMRLGTRSFSRVVRDKLSDRWHD